MFKELFGRSSTLKPWRDCTLTLNNRRKSIGLNSNDRLQMMINSKLSDD